jgi:nicotinamidase-related amidase
MLPDALTVENTVLLLIDFQERLFPTMHEKEKLLNNVLKLIKGAVTLEIPVIITEQYPKGLGPTIPEIKTQLPGVNPIEKTCFSCNDEPAFASALESLKRKQVLIAGIEAHICVYQTAAALSRASYQVEVAGDCIASRDPENRLATLFKLRGGGVGVTTTEMTLFELLKIAKGDKFKQISAIIK